MLPSWLSIFLSAASPSASCSAEEVLRVDRPFTEITLASGQATQIRELGLELEYFEQGQWYELSLPAPRFGRHIVTPEHAGSVLRLRPAREQQHARVGRRVACEAVQEKEFAWLLALQTRTAVPLDANQLNDFRTSVAQAPSPLTKAIGQHHLANLLYAKALQTEAEAAFIAADKLWEQTDQTHMRALALLGAAHLADRRNDIKSAAILAEQAEQYAIATRQPYWQLRAKEIACRRLLHQGDISAHERCLVSLVDAFRALGEQVESISMLIDVASAMRLSGRLSGVDALVARLEEIPATPDLAIVRGRLQLVAALSAQDQGDLAKAIRFFDTALHEFALTDEESERWSINTKQQIAALYSRLGLYEQAHTVLGEALRTLHVKEAPARAANLLASLATVFADSGDALSALRWYAKAETIYRRLGQPAEVAVMQLYQQLAELDLGNTTQPADWAALPNYYRIAAQIGNTRSAIRQGRWVDASLALDSFGPKLSASEATALVLARAELAFAQSQPKLASKLLSDRIAELAAAADTAPSSALAYLQVRGADRLRRAWADLPVTIESPAIFDLALRSNPSRYLTAPAQASGPVGMLKKNASDDLLRALVGLASSPAERLAGSQPLSLAQFQTVLPHGTTALLLVPGHKQTLALWLTRDRSQLSILKGKGELEALLGPLLKSLGAPTSSPALLSTEAKRLASALFVEQTGAPPENLWVIADELSAAIPFSVLPWPGQDQPLVHSTATTLVTALSADSAMKESQTENQPPSIHFIAPSYAAVAGQTLEFAEVERARVAQALPRLRLESYTGAAATGNQVAMSLGSKGQWIHVSAHGKADPGVLGNAGLWLAGSKQEEFLSWLDLSQQASRAELLVLNACQSAAGAQPSRQASLSFALAVSMSGTRHVLASLWPISDVATATWVPVFYQHVGVSGAAQSAQALQHAQLKLLQSPHYRHPYYWASLVHFQRR